MSDIVTAIYGLMAHSDERVDEDRIKLKVDRIFDVSKKEVWLNSTELDGNKAIA